MGKLKVLIASGGSGGHVFPAVAVARSLQPAEIMFLGTGRSGEEKLLERPTDQLIQLSVGKLKGVSILEKLKTVLGIPLAVIKLALAIRSNRPDYILGVGGYTTGPAILVAALLRIPRGVLELNAVPGLANRLSSIFCHHRFGNFFSSGWANCVVGTPIREVLPADKTYDLVITGGSQGALGLNRIVENNLQALLPLVGGASAKVLWQTGKNFQSEKWKDNPQVQVMPFVEGISRYFGGAKLVIARAGANTLEELMATKSVVLAVPFPAATDNHQHANGIKLEQKRALLCHSESDASEQFLSRSRELISNGSAYRSRIAEYHRPNAAARVAEIIRLYVSKKIS